MKTVNMHEAKTHLSRLVQAAVDGESFVIARAGKPMVRVVAVEEERRMGCFEGTITSPVESAEFRAMGPDEIAAMHEGE